MSAHAFYVLSVWIHILAACLWIGGMLFLVLVLIPALRTLPDPRMRAELISVTGRRFRLVGWVTLAVLVITGWTNLYARGVRVAGLFDGAFWQVPFGQVLAWKLVFVLLILTLSVVHDFHVGPKASELASSRQASPEQALRWRRAATWMGRLNLLLALVVAACGVMLARGRPW